MALHGSFYRVGSMIILIMLGLRQNTVETHDTNCLDGSYRITSVDIVGPQLTHTCAGYAVCPKGHFCQGGKKFPCPPGYFGNDTAMKSEICSGICPAGFFCPSATAIPIDCSDLNVYCPRGSYLPLEVNIGYYSDINNSKQTICPPGSFCHRGVRQLCPPGYYGYTAGLSSGNCSGVCVAGFFCPLGTRAYSANGCGRSPHVFCPTGSSRPQLIESGNYAVGPVFDIGGGYVDQLPCLPGSYCAGGISQPCPAGYFGALRNETRPLCIGICTAGFYCPPGSFSSQQKPCGNASVFCVSGSPAPMLATRGHYTTTFGGGSDMQSRHIRSCQVVCQVGSYCSSGISILCPAGTYGSTAGLTELSCSGPCKPGYFCPQGSTSPTLYQCGNAGVICPLGSGLPLPVQAGYHSVGDTPLNSTRYAESICQPGTFCLAGEAIPCPAGRYGSRYAEVKLNIRIA
jgi:hypothetical protein